MSLSRFDCPRYLVYMIASRSHHVTELIFEVWYQRLISSKSYQFDEKKKSFAKSLLWSKNHFVLKRIKLLSFTVLNTTAIGGGLPDHFRPAAYSISRLPALYLSFLMSLKKNCYIFHFYFRFFLRHKKKSHFFFEKCILDGDARPEAGKKPK